MRCVWGNETELVRLFANLLENARRYTPPEGQIRVAARVEGENVVTCVSDTGIGVAPEYLPHLGERFYRVDTARAARRRQRPGPFHLQKHRVGARGNPGPRKYRG